MRTISFDPFWQNSVGFDRIFDLMNETVQTPTYDKYPPYNIAKVGDDRFRISIAVAGFKPDQIAVTAHQNTLIVQGRAEQAEGGVQYLYRGIGGTPFERRFNLADFVEVTDATFSDGVLNIDLERRVPEAMKPRRVDVKSVAGGQAALGTKVA